LYLRDLDHLEAPAGDVILQTSNSPAQLRWSPDGKFIVFAENNSLNSMARIVRVDGTTPSAAVQLVTTPSTPTFAWQP
jgi:hypothetical protein